MRRSRFVARAGCAIVLTVTALTACSGAPSTTAPSHVTATTASTLPPVSPPAPPADGTSAAIVVSSFDVEPAGMSAGSYMYMPALTLTETGGKAAATVKAITFVLPNGNIYSIANDAEPGTGCFLTPQSQLIPAGGVWNLNSVYRYCLDLDNRTPLTGMPVVVEVSFVDSTQHVGAVTGRTIVHD
jgi:hypothetical protein